MSTTLFCCIDSKPVPENRAKRKSFSCVTCSDECYAQLRIIRRGIRRQKGWYVPQRDRTAFMIWKESQAAMRTAQPALDNHV
jgi:hypothetical protein